MNTSRHWILDWLEMIANQIALSSHSQELLYNYYVDIKSTDSSDQYESIAKKIEKETKLLEESIEIRRNMMQNILDNFDWYDHDQWCKWKHALYVWCTATEVYYADINNSSKWLIAQHSYEQMITITSQILGLETLERCGRCMADKL